MLTLSALIGGLSALAILITGYITSIGCLVRNKEQKTKLLKWAAVFLACMGSFYLGTVVSFFSLLLTGSNIPGALAGQICYVWAPIAIGASMYVGFQILKPKAAKPMASIYLITGILYWYGLFFQSSKTIGFEIPESGNGLIDIQLLSYVQLLTAIYLLTFGIILTSGFAWLAKNSTGLIKKKSIYHIIGYLLFVVCGAMDSMVEFSSPYYILIVRAFMIMAYISLYVAYTKTK